MTTLRVRNTSDLIAVVAVAMGFHPTNSLVVMSMSSGPPFAARIDLPEQADAVEATITSMVDGVRANVSPESRLVALWYGDATPTMRPTLTLLDALSPVPLSLVLRVHNGRWYDLTQPDHVGEAYTLDDSPVLAQAAYLGRVIAPSREMMADWLKPRGDTFEDAFERHLRHRSNHESFRHCEALWLRDNAPYWPGTVLSDDDAGRALVAIQDVDVRDVLWSLMSRGNAQGWVDLLLNLAQRAPDRTESVPIFALLAFASWLTGNGAFAWVAIDRADELDRSYALTRLVDQALTVAMPPTTWEPMNTDSLPILT